MDGTTGTAILLQALRLLGAEPDFYVPHRLEEGYGLNAEALRQIAESGAKVVVTVDCGVASLREAEVARELGLELIVTDHHEPKERRPDAAVVVHPRLPPGVYPFGGLSGSGRRVQAGVEAGPARQRRRQGHAALPRLPARRRRPGQPRHRRRRGAAARREPHLRPRTGLNRLRQAPSVGLKALIEAAGPDGGGGAVRSDVAFKLAPRLNAAGRLGCARLVVELLTTTSPQRAVDLARFLEEQNGERQTIERRMVAQAREMVERRLRRRPGPGAGLARTGTAASSASSPAGWPSSTPGRC